jgi:plastocyanin
MNIGRILRIAAAIAILISGIVHLDLYFNDDYRFAGDAPTFGRSLLLNAVASAVIAAAVAARKEWFVRAAGIGFAASTTAVFAFTHSGHTFLGFSASGFEPSPPAPIALAVQIATILLLAATFVPAIDRRDVSLPMPALAVAGAVAAVAVIGMTVRWQPEDQPAVATAPPASTSTVATTATSAPSTATSAPAGASTTTVSAAPTASGAVAVSIKGFAFDGKETTVPKGTTVTWTNFDNVAHSVVATDTSFVSDNLPKGATFEHTFDTAGTFSYICGIHTYMKGTITVTG